MKSQPCKPTGILAGMSLALFLLLLAVELPLPGSEPAGWGGAEIDLPGNLVLPPTPLPETPSPPEGGTSTIVERTTVWRILFPYETFSETLQTGLRELSLGIAKDSLKLAEETLDALMVLGSQPGLFQSLQTEIWQVTIVLAGILLPLALVISIAAALREGALSVHGYLSAREALLQGLLAATAALSSHYLLSRAIDLSSLLSTAILDGIGRSLGQAIHPGKQLVGLLLTSAVLSQVQGLASVFLGFAAVLLCAGLVLGFALAFLAREVLLLLAFGLAPLLLVLGLLAPMRWLQAVWLKTTVLALLLGPANALLLGISVLVALHANQAGLLSIGRLTGFLVAAGILSVLLGMNMLVGKTVYGAVIEIGHKAWAATRKVLDLGGIALGAAAGAQLGAGLSAGAGTASRVGAEGSGLASALGNVARATGLPGMQGLAAGLSLGASPGYNQLQQRLDRLMTGSGPSGPFDPGQAAAQARLRMSAEIPPEAALGRSGLSHPALQERLRAGSVLAEQGFHALSELPLSPSTAMDDLGFRPGEPLQQAATGYARTVIARYALGPRAPADALPSLGNAPQRLAGQDLDTAMQVVLQLKPNPATVSQITPGLLAEVTRTVHQRRSVGQQTPDQIRASAAHASSLADLQAWCHDQPG